MLYPSVQDSGSKRVKRLVKRKAINDRSGCLLVFVILRRLGSIGKEIGGFAFDKPDAFYFEGVPLVVHIVDEVLGLLSGDGNGALRDNGICAEHPDNLLFTEIGILFQGHRLGGEVLQHDVDIFLELVICIGFRGDEIDDVVLCLCGPLLRILHREFVGRVGIGEPSGDEEEEQGFYNEGMHDDWVWC